MDWLRSCISRTQTWRERTWRNGALESISQRQTNSLTKTLDCLLATSNETLKHDQTTTVKHIELQNTSLLLKRYNARNAWHHIKRAFRQSRAERCWRMSYKFQTAGLQVAAPLLMHEHRWGLVHLNAYFATEFLEGKELLSALPRMESNEQNQVVKEVIQAFRIMRQYKLSHGDMKASNLLWVNQQLFFIDLDAAQQHRYWLTWNRANRKDRRRFLKNWLSHPELMTLFQELKD